jgi:hypothetical protein
MGYSAGTMIGTEQRRRSEMMRQKKAGNSVSASTSHNIKHAPPRLFKRKKWRLPSLSSSFSTITTSARTSGNSFEEVDEDDGDDGCDDDECL